MKACLFLPFLLLGLPAAAQSDLRLPAPPAATLQLPSTAAAYRQSAHPLAPVTVRKNRLLSLRYALMQLRDPSPSQALLPAEVPADGNPLKKMELPLGEGNTYLVSGGYFMRERTVRYAEGTALQRTWPVGNELLGIVVKSGLPERVR